MAEAVGRLGAEVVGTCATDYAGANIKMVLDLTGTQHAAR